MLIIIDIVYVMICFFVLYFALILTNIRKKRKRGAGPGNRNEFV